MPTKGYDAFFPPAGARGRMHCRVCGTACQVSRGRIGPTGFAEAMLGAEQPHDSSALTRTCPGTTRPSRCCARPRPSRTGCCAPSWMRGASSGCGSIWAAGGGCRPICARGRPAHLSSASARATIRAGARRRTSNQGNFACARARETAHTGQIDCVGAGRARGG